MGSFRNFMNGRYGMDKLNLFLLLLSAGLVITLRIVSMFIGFYWMSLFGFIPAVFALIRALSRNIQKRRIENERFMKFWSGMIRFFRSIPQFFRDRKQYKYFRCPKCRTKLRVPRMGGKTLEITCRSCHEKFKIKA